MRIALIHNARFPVVGYGGTERLVYWLAKGLSEKGVKVTLVCQLESRCPYAEVIYHNDFTQPYFSKEVDLIHYFYTPSNLPSTPYLITIGGNGKQGETYFDNTVFVSRNHAERHGAEAFVYNGLDPDEYEFQSKKKNYYSFCAKASWNVKNVKGAIRLCRKKKEELHIMGGKKLWGNHWGNIHWEGMVDGKTKAHFLANAKALLFPVIWDEPFGIAVTEAFISGTPVLGSPFGSLPELIHPKVGRICSTELDFLNAMDQLSEIKAEDCRDWAVSQFHYAKMAENYIQYYQRVLNGEKINSQVPKAKENPKLFAI